MNRHFAPALLTLLTLAARPSLAQATEHGAEGPADSAVAAGSTPGEAASDGHVDVTLGLGVLTSGAGLALGYRAPFGLRAEVAAGTAILVTGASAGLGWSFLVLNRGGHRLEVPLMGYGIAAASPELDDSSGTRDTLGLGAASGLDWTFGRTRNGVGFHLTARTGIASYTTRSKGGYDEYGGGYADSESTELAPIVQLGAGWSF